MARSNEPTVIKKYANRRLYNTGTSMYVTLENLAAMVKGNEDFVVQDAKTGEDITHSVLTQIIFEQENKGGQTLMPITFLRQLIRFYGDQMQMVVPAYLEQSMAAFQREQESFRATSANPLQMMETQVRRNTEMFREAMAVFNPFMANALGTAAEAAKGASAPPKPTAPPAPTQDDLSAMRDQLAEMQRRIEALDAKKN
ncbi:polyhydroxyalkanoate synthesis repressor PhaR [Aureimonas phyllosphaerae]|uniref:Polyhydroxyalkanoate synthesis repressor PhaR n=1 Tax=Aureimonas phyllosphaerae TaxID=1166078 RepID=A0A7W6BTS4_9HYPH|nr:polyhydroxyalkanoate synthesis repressor PhaR [Aureimonas phyllosphaerae]MBB3937879.1 polyhydroxyalkanoate synthesis repressor PhaR [Aureimonas phyllosphaerae]MBB3961948.1 polyhydroxyalkanoate synthesis repressor PhaR [Aureimonas phyllosphaerae]SFF57267.1 polyhydroxyalkanoate synthesis repressor PhaR [Aureimonas phyllosphaerae]